MPVLDNERAIQEYWDLVKHKYPGMEFSEFRTICKSPFEYIKKCIASGTFPRILVKYLGKFKIFEGRIRNLMTENQRKYDAGWRTEVEYIRIKNELAEHLKNIQDDNEDDDEDDDEDDEGGEEIQ